MSNELPSGFTSLTDLANDMIDGLHDHGNEIGVKQWTEPALTAKRDAALAAKKAHSDAGSSEDHITKARKIANSNAMSGLAGELGSLLADDSADWYYFGLVPPAKGEPPAPAEHLAIHQAGPTTAVAGCDRSPRGQKYIFALQVIGRDEKPVEQPARLEPQITFENLPAASTVKITVTVQNAAGKSATTGPVEIILK